MLSEFAIVGETVTALGDRDKAPQSKRGIVPQSGESNGLLTIDGDRYKSEAHIRFVSWGLHSTQPD
jgi:hypothetical protein